jgi:hypothetical protein
MTAAVTAAHHLGRGQLAPSGGRVVGELAQRFTKVRHR